MATKGEWTMTIYYDPENFVARVTTAALTEDGELADIATFMRPGDEWPTTGQIIDMYIKTKNTTPGQLNFTIHELIDFIENIPMVDYDGEEI